MLVLNIFCMGAVVDIEVPEYTYINEDVELFCMELETEWAG